jgi:hypothetical protein
MCAIGKASLLIFLLVSSSERRKKEEDEEKKIISSEESITNYRCACIHTHTLLIEQKTSSDQINLSYRYYDSFIFTCIHLVKKSLQGRIRNTDIYINDKNNMVVFSRLYYR